MINIALFGAGRIGSIHAHNIARHNAARLVGLYDPVTDNAERLGNALNCELMTAKQIFSSADIDAVLICSATNTHADLIEQAIAAGKHVFCEKPIDLSLARVRQCLHRIADSDRKIMVAFNRRFDPQFQQLRQQLKDGAIGNLELVSLISKDPTPPPIAYVTTSGGLFRDMTIHDFDMARFLLNDEVVSLNAQASCQIDSAIAAAGDVDTAVITLSTASGRLAQISNSRRASFGYDQRIEAHGSKGMLVAQNVNENSVLCYNQAGVASAKPLNFFLQRYAESYRTELDSFIRYLTGEPLVLPSLQDGLLALAMAEAALLSIRKQRTVKLSEIN